jgi:hypothetical protein
MESKTIDADAIRPQLIRTGYKVLATNLVMLAVGIAIIYLLLNKDFILPFTMGVLAGIFNLYMYQRLLKKSLTKPLDKMASFVITRYYVKFMIILAILGILIAKLELGPLPLLAGFVATIMTTIIAMVFISRKEFA